MDFIANIIPGATGASGSRPNATDLSGKSGGNENSPFAALVSKDGGADASATPKTDIEAQGDTALNMATLLFQNQAENKPLNANGDPASSMNGDILKSISDLVKTPVKVENTGLISSWQQTAANMQNLAGNVENIALAGQDNPFSKAAALKANGLPGEGVTGQLPELSGKTNTDQAALNGIIAAKANMVKNAAAAKSEINAQNASVMDPANSALATFAKMNTAFSGKSAPDLAAAMINGAEAAKPAENSASSLAFENTLNISTDKLQSFQTILQNSQTDAKPAVLPINTVAVEIAQKFGTGANRFQIRLDPPELGRIDVRMDVSKEGQVTAHLIVEKPETLSALNKDAQALERALNASGLETKENGLNFSLSGGNHSFEGEENTARSGIKDETDILNAHEIEASNANKTLRGYISSSGVDIHV